MLSQQLTPLVEQTNGVLVPLHLHTPRDPAWRSAIIRRIDLDATVPEHSALAEVVRAERLDWQSQLHWTFFRRQGSNLPFGRPVHSSIGPPLFPRMHDGLRLLQPPLPSY